MMIFLIVSVTLVALPGLLIMVHSVDGALVYGLLQHIIVGFLHQVIIVAVLVNSLLAPLFSVASKKIR